MILQHLREKKNWGLLAAALVIGLLAFWLTHRYLAEQEQRLAESFRPVQTEQRAVVVATQHLQPGEVITQHNMDGRLVPTAFLSEETIPPNEFHLVSGFTLKYPLSPGEPLLRHHLDVKPMYRFSHLLEPGERAVSFEIGSLESISGMLLPGDYIDILAEFTEPSPNDGSPQAAIKPLLQRVRVLSVDEMRLAARDQANVALPFNDLGYGSITVAARYEDAVALTLARNHYQVRFLLRNENDDNLVSSRSRYGYELFNQNQHDMSRRRYHFYGDSGSEMLDVESNQNFSTRQTGTRVRRQPQPSDALATHHED